MKMTTIIKKWLLRMGILILAELLLAGMVFTLPGCNDAGSHSDGRIKIATDIFPIADFCRNVGGDLVEVESMVPAGSNPHTYEITTRQMRYLSEADMLVVNGLELAPWVDDVFESVYNPDLVEVVAGEAVPTNQLMAEQEEGDSEVYDPHVWLDPILAVYMIDSIRDGLAATDPKHESSYRRNAEDYITQLLDLDVLIADMIAQFSSKKFIAFHPSWTYFARRYGLDQVGVIEEQPGKEPSAGWIAGLIDATRNEGVRAVFSEPQFSSRAAEAIAEEAGPGVALKMLDPMGDPANPQMNSYMAFMKHDVEVMREALK
ncbi:MAG: hypothetical protein A2W01_11750 [Candidatus Solincola sediminis]|uniref:Zinc ABC transporter substrate-binding protein n=1 Tax=Candidatus Solincola sediminis TaxID=1797199 RepID=A0A1F2WTT8_9ACTN|nr:MAG: hypothetical protein A2Y75_02345 [Candidatus Solincola sediminis]OFW60860.1 MAG: hypothetical protein A2W01_11750 [Candidatus Solincola sediminis]